MQPGLLEPRRSTAYMMRRDSKPRMSITRRMSAIDFSRSNTRPTRQRQPAPIIPITQGYVLMKKKNLEWRAKQEVQKLDASDGTDYLISNSNQQKFVKSSDLTRKNHSSKLNLIEKGTSEYQDLFCVNDYQKQWSKLAKRKKKKQAFLPSRDLKMQIDQCSIPIRLRKGFAYKGMFYIRKGNYPGRVTFEGKHVDDFVLEIYFNEDDFIQKKVSLIYLSNSFLLKRQATSKDTFYFRLFARKRLVGQLKFDFLIPEEDIPIELRKDYSALELDEHEKIGYIFNRFQSSKAFKEYEKGGVKSTKLAMKRRVPRTIIQANRNIVHQFSPEQRMVRMEENRADKEIRKIEILHRKDRVKKEKSLIKWISTKKNILKKELVDIIL